MCECVQFNYVQAQLRNACYNLVYLYIVRVAVRSITEAREHYSSFFTLFQVAFGLPIAFWTSLEGSVIEMKSATLAPQDTAVSLKA